METFVVQEMTFDNRHGFDEMLDWKNMEHCLCMLIYRGKKNKLILNSLNCLNNIERVLQYQIIAIGIILTKLC